MTDAERRAIVLRESLVGQIERDFPQVSAAKLAAIRDVPRHRFVPEVDLKDAYVDDAVITRRDEEGRSISAISQPNLVAQMLDMLDLRPDQRVQRIRAPRRAKAGTADRMPGLRPAVVLVFMVRTGVIEL